MAKTNPDASTISLNAHELNSAIKTDFSEWIFTFQLYATQQSLHFNYSFLSPGDRKKSEVTRELIPSFKMNANQVNDTPLGL